MNELNNCLRVLDGVNCGWCDVRGIMTVDPALQGWTKLIQDLPSMAPIVVLSASFQNRSTKDQQCKNDKIFFYLPCHSSRRGLSYLRSLSNIISHKTRNCHSSHREAVKYRSNPSDCSNSSLPLPQSRSVLTIVTLLVRLQVAFFQNYYLSYYIYFVT